MRDEACPPVTAERGFEIASELAAPAAEVWAHATTLAGVNRELWPLARMTHPPGFETLSEASVTLGRRLFRSWILFAGVLPVDYDDLTLVELEPGRRFLERSPMATQRLWVHEREVLPRGAGCTVVDRLRFVPRIALLGPLHLVLFRAAFGLRHRNLRRWFGTAQPGPQG